MKTFFINLQSVTLDSQPPAVVYSIFRRNRIKKYDFERNATKTQQIISRKIDEMELNQNHSGQAWFFPVKI